MPLFPVFFKNRPITPSNQPKPQVAPKDVEEIQAKAREIILEAKDEAFRLKDQAIKDAQVKLTEIKDQTILLAQKQRELFQQEEKNNHEKGLLASEREELEKQKEKLRIQAESLAEKIEKIAGLSREEARKQLLEGVKKNSVAFMAKVIKDVQDEAKDTASEKAKDILVDSMQVGATDYVAEYTVSTVTLPSEDIKAKIIGKDGRNIRTFENKSGVDIDMDETPGMIRISCFNSIRREIARVALVRLIKDGRIQPVRIEEYLDKAKLEVNQIMYQEGEKLCHAVGVYNLPRDLVAMLGRFKFRTSYGQNMISHTLEETRIGIKLAYELKANVETVRLGCLLHDLGKVSDDTEGSHVELGVKLLKKYNIPQPVIDCVAQHHEDEEFSSSESILTYIADAISGSRPGARHENYDEYIKRINTLETIAKEYPGVDDAFAIQAGRELRVIVKPDQADDDRIIVMADEIRNKIQDSLTYPGTVKVTVIRETRATQVAK